MSQEDWIKNYYFHEHEWDSYDQLCEWFEWRVPEFFNMAKYICDRYGDEKGRIALIYDNGEIEEKYSFWEIKNLSNQLANVFKELGVKKGDRIGVNVTQKPENLISHLATWKVGAISIPLSILFGTTGLKYRLKDSGSRVVIVDKENLDMLRVIRKKMDNLNQIIVVGEKSSNEEFGFWELLKGRSRKFEHEKTKSEDPALLCYTSGTTGLPKGVLHRHEVLLGHLPMFLMSFCNLEIKESDIAWTPADWAWIAGLFDVLFPSLFYKIPVLASPERFEPERTFRLIEKYGLSITFIPPTGLRMMMTVEKPEEKYNLESVRVIPSGGEALGKEIPSWIEKTFPDATVHEGYGQTEANLLVGNCSKLFKYKSGSMGKPIPGHELSVLDEEGKQVGVQKTGELAVRRENNPVVFEEYWNKPEMTKDKFLDNWLLTEDLVKKNDENYFWFHSRKDDVIISAGYRIGPEEIEDVLGTHDTVVDSAVVGISNESRGEVPKAFIQLVPDVEPSNKLKKRIQNYVKEKLAAYEYPRQIAFVKELPKTTTGKIKRSELRGQKK